MNLYSFTFCTYTAKIQMLIDMLSFVFSCSLMAQRKDVITLGGPYGSGTVRLNKGLQT